MNKLLFLNIGVPELFLALLYPIMVIYCLIDIIRSTFKDPTNKIIWIIVVILMPCLGSVLYLVIGRGSKIG
ncbi:PLDc N-terminal domain-containing protein [Mucilaginibacter celer]|uniref:PLDc_N domain-containing protein n=1 Tax=Mucilaginibacter celer TaxID=2305508 RepID=A0A494W1X7_9SPHI|nr:PLD nuclease N-terminal domain-containing protein [Mucilaginibacter celer]AYL97538.1 PLDc_N domain-containing protein [Mucilaginibacter celer]